MKKQKQQKQFIVRKYVMASSAIDAIRKEKNKPVDDVWLDADWEKKQNADRPSAIGFSNSENTEDEE
jgi:hypothetical protein